MRLFIAINFDDQTKGHIADIQQQLQKTCFGGSFSSKENLHLTLAFLGEQTRTNNIIHVMETCAFTPFTIAFDQVGRFRRDGGDIYWIGVRHCPPLLTLQSSLEDGLRSYHFELENRKFTPHVTLARQVVKDETFTPIFQPFSMDVRHISLMKSERIRGVLRYSEVFGVSSRVLL